MRPSKRTGTGVLKRALAAGFAGLLLSLFSAAAYCQTWDELFRQKKTQRRYLAEQVTALKAYGAAVRAGYELVSAGLAAYRGITRGEWQLHRDFFASLKEVSPQVSRSGRAQALGELLAGIARSAEAWKTADGLSDSERAYVRSVREAVLDECGRDLERVLQVLSPGQLEMGDAGRLAALEGALAEARERAAFVRRFTDALFLLGQMRQREQGSNERLQKLFK